LGLSFGIWALAISVLGPVLVDPPLLETLARTGKNAFYVPNPKLLVYSLISLLNSRT
jgi:hypothetical protein